MENPTFSYLPELYDENYEIYSGEDFYVDWDDISNVFRIKFYQNEDSYNAVYDSDYNIPPNTEDPIIVYNYKYQMETDTIFANSVSNPTILYSEENGKLIDISGLHCFCRLANILFCNICTLNIQEN